MQSELYDEIENEVEFVRWYEPRSDVSSRDVIRKFLTAFICLMISVIGFMLGRELMPLTTAIVVGVGVFAGLLCLTNLGALRRIRSQRYVEEGIHPVLPCKGMKFYFLNNHEEILFIEGAGWLIGMGLLKLRAVPLEIKGNFERFIRSLYQQRLPFYLLYVQSPIGQGAIQAAPTLEPNTESSNEYWGARILLGVRREGKRPEDLYRRLTADLFKVKTAFVSAYPHTILEPLAGEDLKKALSIPITGGGIPKRF